MNFELDKMVVLVHVSTEAYPAMVQTLDKLHLVVVLVLVLLVVHVVVVVVVSVQIVLHCPANHQTILQLSFSIFVCSHRLTKYIIILKLRQNITLIDSFPSA